MTATDTPNHDATQTEGGLRFIYWFAYFNRSSPSVRYRGAYPLQYMEKEFGISSYFIIPSYSVSGIALFIRAYFSALLFRKSGSAIVIQRIHSGFIYSTLLKLLVRIRRKNTFYDIDDADYLEHPPRSIYYFARNCSAVFVGSNELRKNLSQRCKKIFLHTSPVPDPLFRKDERNTVFTIGWIGDFRGGHSESMKSIFFPAILALPFKVNLVLMGVTLPSESEFLTHYFREAKNVQLEIPVNIDWNDETRIQERIAEFDIGIATLLDNELHRSKSAFKAKQYLNNGVPVLSSDFPENNYFIEHGSNGFLCSTPAQFTARIMQVRDMAPEEYRAFSHAAAGTSPKFNLENYCSKLIGAYESVS